MPKEIYQSEPISLPEVKDLLIKRSHDGEELSYMQRIALEHAQLVSRISAETSQQLMTELIEKFQPLIHLCGHAHDAKGEARIDQTNSINIGPLADGNALLVDLEKGKKASFKRVKV